MREIRRHWVCRLAFRKMAVTFSTCSKSDEIRVRDICLHRFPPLKKKKQKPANTHIPRFCCIYQKVNAMCREWGY